jgi:hypothetical protein
MTQVTSHVKKKKAMELSSARRKARHPTNTLFIERQGFMSEASQLKVTQESCQIK